MNSLTVQLCSAFKKEDLYIELEENLSLILASSDVETSLQEFLVYVAAHSGTVFMDKSRVLVGHAIDMYNTVTNANSAPNGAIECYFGP